MSDTLAIAKAVTFAEDAHHDARCDFMEGDIPMESYWAVVDALAQVRAIAASGALALESA